MRLLLFIAFTAILASSVVWMAQQAYQLPANDNLVSVAQMTLHRSGVEPSGAPQTLPHYWKNDSLESLRASPATETDWYYTADVELDIPPNELWAVFLPTVMQDAELRLNGKLVGAPLPPAHHGRSGLKSLYFALPGRLATRGSNTISVLVRAEPAESGMLGKFFIGPANDLRPLHDRRVEQHRLLWYTIAMLTVLILTGLVLSRGQQHDLAYGWFSALCLAWVVALALRILTESPIPWRWVELLAMLARIGYICAAYVFFLTCVDMATKRVKTVIAAAGFVNLVVYTASSVLQIPGTVHLQLSLGLLHLIGLYVGANFFRVAMLRRSDDLLAMAAGGLLVLGFGIYHTHVGTSSDAPTLNYLNYLSPVIFLCFGYVLLRRFAKAMDLQAEAQPALAAFAPISNVPVATADTSAGATATGTRRLLVAERERIMRDMHDGVGGHLVSSLSILRNHNIADPDLEEALNQALVDLRLMIDSLEDTEGDLSVAVAMLKERTQRTLRGSPLTTSWEIGEIMLPERGPTDTLQILRILQESISNVLKHANASQLDVSAQMADSQTAVFVVQDNGDGIDSATAVAGRGLQNIQRRAETLGGTLTVTSDQHKPGTKVELRVPNRREANHREDSTHA